MRGRGSPSRPGFLSHVALAVIRGAITSGDEHDPRRHSRCSREACRGSSPRSPGRWSPAALESGRGTRRPTAASPTRDARTRPPSKACACGQSSKARRESAATAASAASRTRPSLRDPRHVALVAETSTDLTGLDHVGVARLDLALRTILGLHTISDPEMQYPLWSTTAQVRSGCYRLQVVGTNATLVERPIMVDPILTISTAPFGNGRVSSGLSSLFLDLPMGHRLLCSGNVRP